MNRVEADAYRIRSAVTPCGRVDDLGLNPQIVSEFCDQAVAYFYRQFGSVRVTDDDAVILDMVAELLDHIHKSVHRVRSSPLFSDADHLSFVIHVDDRTDADQGPHRGGQPADASASLEEFQVRSPIYRNKTAYFLTGFETVALWKNIVDFFLYTGKYLWIYGRKNMKLILHHAELFQYLNEKALHDDMDGIDFKCLFLNPESSEVKVAHRNPDILSSELNTTIKRASNLIGDNQCLKKCFRKYSHRRDEIIIRLDNAILYSKPHFDSNGVPNLITNSMFEVFSATSERGKEYCQKYIEVWNNAIPMF